MNNRKNLLVGFVLILFTSAQSSPLLAGPPAGSPLKNKVVPVIELSGNGYDRGLKHGILLKKEIAEVYGKWKDDIHKNTGSNADSVIAKFYASTNFEPIIKKLEPDLLEEVKGIAKGSGQTYRDVLCFQLVDEFWVYFDRLHHEKSNHCSGIGVAAANGHPAYISQNMDVESFRNGYQVLLHIAQNKDVPQQYVLSCAGLIALNGVNQYSIGVCVNTLMELKASTDGLPVAFVIRSILTKKTGKEALEFLQTVKHASGQNYILGVKDKVYDFEASAGKVVRFIPNASNPSLVYHTNHAIANDDIKPWYVEEHRQIIAGLEKKDNSVIRFASLKSRLDFPGNTVSVEKIKQTLRSKDDLKNPVCRDYSTGRSGFTFSSVILTLGENPSIQLTAASPDQAEYVEHFFNK